MANIQQSMSLTNIQTTVHMSVVVLGAQKLEAQMSGIRARIGAFKKSIEDSGLGSLDLGGFIKGGGLLEPFIHGIKQAIKAEDDLQASSQQLTQLKAPQVPLGETSAHLKQFDDALQGVSLKMGQALLPAVNQLITGLTPLISSVGAFVADNPALVEGLAAAAVAFTVVTTGAMGLAAVVGLLASPVGIVAAAIAVAAGLIVAYWEPISEFFSGIWNSLQQAAQVAFATFKSLFGWSPLQALAGAWGALTGFFSGLWSSVVGEATQAWAPLSEFFSGLWQGIQALALPLLDFFKTLFSWSPLGLVIDNWQPLTGLFSALWELLRALSVPVMSFFKTLFDWSPLGLVINHWQPLLGFFGRCWDGLRALSEPVLGFFKTLFDWSPLGLVINNWQPLMGFFGRCWDGLRAQAEPVLGFFKTLFDWSPLGLVINNWQPLMDFFSATWDQLLALSAPVGEFFRALFDWSPMPLINAAWEPVAGFFSGLWDSLLAITAPVQGFLQELFNWSPMDMVMANWQPIADWFSAFWDKLKGTLGGIREMLGGSFGGFIAKITGKVEGLTEAQQRTNAEGKGQLAPAFFGAEASPAARNLNQGSGALVQQSAANNRTQLEGGLTVRFENAPAGMRTSQPQTNQPGLAVTPRIGYRSLSLGGSNELA
ncbi:phage tail protein [Pseudomonas piscis]|uniref:phage tail protein n=1 Tax=Pseudomonas piscis TaxID=2614538 RepID=UPI0021D5B1AD|nr:phage tail protein [Pseudomonas piscis]MCU7649489.1 phage tail protein [Pseudomonas piscis]